MKAYSVEELTEKHQHKTKTYRMAILVVALYIFTGVIYYHFAEKLSVLDSFYLVLITFVTVGYGDIPVQNHIFSAFFCLCTVSIVGGLFGIVSSDLLDYHQEAMAKKTAAASRRMSSIIGKLSRRMAIPNSSVHAEDDTQQGGGMLRHIMDSIGDTAEAMRQSIGYSSGRIADGATARSRTGTTKRAPSRKQVMNLALNKVEHIYRTSAEDEIDTLFHSTVAMFGLCILVILVGGAIQMVIEGWQSYSDGFYWACLTITTIGYGDVVPITNGGKVFCIIYAIVGCTVGARAFGMIVQLPLLARQKQTEIEVIEQFGTKISERILQKILDNDFFERIENMKRQHTDVSNPKILKGEFMLMVLSMMGKLSDNDITMAAQIFDRLDSDGSGELDHNVRGAVVDR